MKNLFYLLLLLISVSCSQNDPSETGENTAAPPIDFLDCNELRDHYKLYDGEDISCEFHYRLTEYEGERFIELHAHCADLTRNVVINSNCEDICENDPYNADSPCGKYLASRTDIEILLIEK